jgi:hypothetical protein
MDPTVNRPRLGDRIEDSPVDGLLSQLNLHCTVYNRPLRIELSETTAADIYDPDTELDELAFHELTIWIPYRLDDLIENMPTSMFAQMPHRYDRYEAVNDECTLTFRFDQSHEKTRVVPTDYDYLQVEIPTYPSFLEKSRECFDDATP